MEMGKLIKMVAIPVSFLNLSRLSKSACFKMASRMIAYVFNKVEWIDVIKRCKRWNVVLSI